MFNSRIQTRYDITYLTKGAGISLFNLLSQRSDMYMRTCEVSSVKAGNLSRGVEESTVAALFFYQAVHYRTTSVPLKSNTYSMWPINVY